MNKLKMTVGGKWPRYREVWQALGSDGEYVLWYGVGKLVLCWTRMGSTQSFSGAAHWLVRKEKP